MVPIRYLTLVCTAVAVGVASFVMPSARVEAGGTCHPGEGVSDERGTTVTMADNCFVATVLRVDEGATVTFLNKDSVLHSVTGVAFSWGDETAIGEGETIQHVFDENGVYVYTCLLHPGMAGAIVVGDGSGRGPAAASIDGDDVRSVLATGVGDAEGVADAAAATTADATTTADEDGNTTLTLGIVAAGAVLLAGIVGGSMALARSSGRRNSGA
jgi:plastocyanin